MGEFVPRTAEAEIMELWKKDPRLAVHVTAIALGGLNPSDQTGELEFSRPVKEIKKVPKNK